MGRESIKLRNAYRDRQFVIDRAPGLRLEFPSSDTLHKAGVDFGRATSSDKFYGADRTVFFDDKRNQRLSVEFRIVQLLRHELQALRLRRAQLLWSVACR
jgi:hypothetical protein